MKTLVRFLLGGTVAGTGIAPLTPERAGRPARGDELDDLPVPPRVARSR